MTLGIFITLALVAILILLLVAPLLAYYALDQQKDETQETPTCAD